MRLVLKDISLRRAVEDGLSHKEATVFAKEACRFSRIANGNASVEVQHLIFEQFRLEVQPIKSTQIVSFASTA